jgi:cardiolipin synthase
VNSRWQHGNRARLLENGEEFFPAVFDAIRAARSEVRLETFIVFEDKVDMELQAALLDAAKRGVRVDAMVDGFGSSDLTPGYIGALTAAGVRLRIYDPQSRRSTRRPPSRPRARMARIGRQPRTRAASRRARGDPQPSAA